MAEFDSILAGLGVAGFGQPAGASPSRWRDPLEELLDPRASIRPGPVMDLARGNHFPAGPDLPGYNGVIRGETGFGGRAKPLTDTEPGIQAHYGLPQPLSPGSARGGPGPLPMPSLAPAPAQSQADPLGGGTQQLAPVASPQLSTPPPALTINGTVRGPLSATGPGSESYNAPPPGHFRDSGGRLIRDTPDNLSASRAADHMRATMDATERMLRERNGGWGQVDPGFLLSNYQDQQQRQGLLGNDRMRAEASILQARDPQGNNSPDAQNSRSYEGQLALWSQNNPNRPRGEFDTLYLSSPGARLPVYRGGIPFGRAGADGGGTQPQPASPLSSLAGDANLPGTLTRPPGGQTPTQYSDQYFHDRAFARPDGTRTGPNSPAITRLPIGDFIAGLPADVFDDRRAMANLMGFVRDRYGSALGDTPETRKVNPAFAEFFQGQTPLTASGDTPADTGRERLATALRRYGVRTPWGRGSQNMWSLGVNQQSVGPLSGLGGIVPRGSSYYSPLDLQAAVQQLQGTPPLTR